MSAYCSDIRIVSTHIGDTIESTVHQKYAAPPEGTVQNLVQVMLCAVPQGIRAHRPSTGRGNARQIWEITKIAFRVPRASQRAVPVALMPCMSINNKGPRTHLTEQYPGHPQRRRIRGLGHRLGLKHSSMNTDVFERIEVDLLLRRWSSTWPWM